LEASLKRSEVIALGAVGLLMTAAFWPSNQQAIPAADPALKPGDGFQTLAFASLAECKDSQAVTAATCETEYAKASQATTEDAPKFEALKDCEAEYGASQCRPATWNGASVFIPAMAGVLIARSLTNAVAARSQPLYPPRTGPGVCPPGVSVTERPECAPRSSSTSSSSGSSGSRSSGGSYWFYSTGTGSTVGRTSTSAVTDTVLPTRSTTSRSSVSRNSSFSSPSSSSSSVSRSSSYSSPSSSTVSRGGFGSTSSAHSSGS
jgi:uncharacterized protein YgiB involved in biofilm formation